MDQPAAIASLHGSELLRSDVIPYALCAYAHYRTRFGGVVERFFGDLHGAAWYSIGHGHARAFLWRLRKCCYTLALCKGELSSQKEADMNFETFFFLVLSWFFLTVLGIDLNSFGI